MSYQHKDCTGRVITVEQYVALARPSKRALGKIYGQVESFDATHVKVNTRAVNARGARLLDRVYWHEPSQLRVLEGVELTWRLLNNTTL